MGGEREIEEEGKLFLLPISSPSLLWPSVAAT